MVGAKMTANELANALKDMESGWFDDLTLKQAATMLRQQQAEIEALKKDNKELHAIAQRMAMAESDARKSLQWFKDEKEMNNEPVAWIKQNPETLEAELHFDKPTKYWATVISNPDIPLYTHPAELTDEVIEQVRVAIMGAAYWCADENMPEAYNAVKLCCGQVLGILDKAQEK